MDSQSGGVSPAPTTLFSSERISVIFSGLLIYTGKALFAKTVSVLVYRANVSKDGESMRKNSISRFAAREYSRTVTTTLADEKPYVCCLVE